MHRHSDRVKATDYLVQEHEHYRDTAGAGSREDAIHIALL